MLRTLLGSALAAALLMSASPALAQDGGVVVATNAVELSDSTPDRYVIQTGDTLWDISSRFMGDAGYWPRLWSFNDYITNPHWIYPGNVIVFRPGTLLDPPGLELDGGAQDGYIVDAADFELSEPECGPDINFTSAYAAATYTTASMLADELELWGEVKYAKTGATHLGEGDLVYLRMDDPDLVACGDVIAVYREGRKVRHPDAKDLRYGRLYHVVAELRVVHTTDEMVSAVVRRSFREMRRGDRVGPAYPVTAKLPTTAPKGDLDGVIIARSGLDQYELAATGETVFLDRGRADGLRVGNSFFIIHHRDENFGVDHEDLAIPDQVVGRVVVTRVEEDHAAAIVVDASRPISVGDAVSMTVE